MATPRRFTRRPTSHISEPGIVSHVIPPTGVRRTKTKIKPKQKVNSQQVSTIIERRLASVKTVKYLETLITATSLTTTGQFFQITTIPQGSAQNQRVVDTVWLQRIDLSLGITTANADIFNLGRITFLNWKVSSALASPTTAEIFTNWTNALVHSFLNFERRDLYSVVHDSKYNFTGVSTVPTINSQHYLETTLPMKNHRIDFDPGVTTGTGHIYLFLASDSSALPFPVININLRVWYYDE
jgi:hypothetical protein